MKFRETLLCSVVSDALVGLSGMNIYSATLAMPMFLLWMCVGIPLALVIDLWMASLEVVRGMTR